VCRALAIGVDELAHAPFTERLDDELIPQIWQNGARVPSSILLSRSHPPTPSAKMCMSPSFGSVIEATVLPDCTGTWA
jgi:hypothetical protein